MATLDLAPTGAGATTNLVPDPSGTNWSCVVSTDGYTVQRTGPAGATDCYQMADTTSIPDGAIIDKVVVTVSGLYSDGGGVVGAGLYIGITIYADSAAISGDSFSYEMTTNPATSGAWTKTAINDSQLALYLEAGSGKYSYANKMWATVHYHLPPSGGSGQIIGLEAY